MIKTSLFAMAAAAVLASTTPAFAANDSISVDYARKDAVNQPQYNNVFGLTYGHSVETIKGLSVEGRMEMETANRVAGPVTTKQESLAQVKASYVLPYSFWGVEPYVAGGVGYKAKATAQFPFYVAEVGGKYVVPAFDNRFTVKVSTRLRSPLNQSDYGTTSSPYRTVETGAQVGYTVNKNYVVNVKYAAERGDSKNTVLGAGLTRKF